MPHIFRGSHRAHTISTPEHNHGIFSSLQDIPSTYSSFRSGGVLKLPPDEEIHRSREHHRHHQHAGAEPGVNPRSGEAVAEYSHFKQDCAIDVIDYDCEDATFQSLSNERFIGLLKEDVRNVQNEDEGLPPRMVRWINIGGIDWSVLSAIALKYNLHSLALEDILHECGHTHSKADYYPGHLFLRILCHSLERSSQEHGISSMDLSPDPSGYGCKKQPDLENLLEEGSPKIRFRNGSENSISSQPITTTTPDILKGNGKGKSKAADQTDSRQALWASSVQKRFTGLSGFGGPAREEKKMQIRALTEGDRVHVNREPMFIFLLQDGTVISIHPTLSLEYTAPITERLHRLDSVLRTSEDASLLVESLLDLIVDRVLEVVDEYQVKINKLEHDILLRPDMRSVRSLHILSGDLILHKRTLEPIRTMVYGLRRYDLERCRALADNIVIETDYSSDPDAKKEKKTNGRPKESTTRDKRKRRRRKQMLGTEPLLGTKKYLDSQSTGADFQGKEEERPTTHQHSIDHLQRVQFRRRQDQVEGFFSYKAKVYLREADVSDHMDFALTSLDMFAGISENLINYAFNIVSYEMNIVMNRLTMATIIFLPLTLLTGYFGMNFSPFWSVENNSDVFFWKIAIPVMAALVPIFMYKDILDAIRYLMRRAESRQATSGKRF